MLGLTHALLFASLAASASAEAGAGGWSFRKADKPVKVVVIAGSIGAYAKRPYHERLEEVCTAIEVKNLSKTGIGAYAMKQRFRDEVLKNSAVDPKKRKDEESWVLLSAGTNNLYAPETANHHLKNLMVLGHMEGWKTVALSPTPWGTEKDPKHRGLEGLRRRDASQLVTDFLLGRLAPAEAFGDKASQRPAGATGPWDPLERPDVAVDLYDSDLRDRDAAARDEKALRIAIAKDRSWRRAHEGDDEATRDAALAADAKRAAELPKWFMKPSLRGFDDVHPNTDGHRVMAQAICPKLPESWSCACEKL